MASFGSCARIRYPWQMRNQNQNLGGSRARRWFGYLWHEWIGERWRPIAPAFARPNPAEWSDNRITAAWLGHATVLINFFGIKIPTDPVLFPRIGIRLPGLTLGPKRLTASALTVRDLPKIDIVLLFHARFDHFDMRTLHRFHRGSIARVLGGKPQSFTLVIVRANVSRWRRAWTLVHSPFGVSANVQEGTNFPNSTLGSRSR